MKMRRVGTNELSSGLRGTLTAFENAVKKAESGRWEYSELSSINKGDLDSLEEAKDRAKQTLLRKLRRMENGPDLAHIEQIKRDLRKLAKAYVSSTFDHDLVKMANEINIGTRRL